ncbi:unnamed protein product, partial [Hapterophycus canaliculatus]
QRGFTKRPIDDQIYGSRKKREDAHALRFRRRWLKCCRLDRVCGFHAEQLGRADSCSSLDDRSMTRWLGQDGVGPNRFLTGFVSVLSIYSVYLRKMRRDYNEENTVYL